MRRALLHQCRHSDKLAVDDLLPILVFVIIKSAYTHWIATIHYLKHFIFTEFSDGSDKGVDSFLITTLEAAVLYIQTIDLREFKKSAAPYQPAIESTPRRHFTSKEHFIDYLFSKIMAEDEVEIIKLLKTDKDVIIHGVDKQTSEINRDEDGNDALSLQRSVDIDDGIDEGVVEEIDVISKFPESRLNLQNRYGVGAIHVAAMHGLPKMLNALLALGVDLHITDENNYTALHYAASRGHQNTLLLLLHAGADINATTNDKSTALHLSSLNGHSNCVKALLYYCDHMKVRIDRNAQNKFGDTALHLAAKWGFSEIIDTQLEYGVKCDIRNRSGLLAVDLAHNSQIALRLQNARCDSGKEHHSEVTSDYEDQSTCSSLTASTTSLNHEVFRGCFSTGLNHTIDTVDSVSMLQKTCNDKIVTAIRNNDTKLACHFLGIDAPTDHDDAAQSVCHPLCDCDKCKHITEYLSRKSNHFVQSANGIYDGKINECSTDGVTPLHAAIQMKNQDLVEKILQMGAQVSVLCKDTKRTAIHLAVLSQSIDILNLILNHLGPIENGNDIDLQDCNGDTALHLAVRLGDVPAIDVILKHEPNIFIRNSDNKTAIEIAKSLLNLNVIRRLEMAENDDLRNNTQQNKTQSN